MSAAGGRPRGPVSRGVCSLPHSGRLGALIPAQSLTSSSPGFLRMKWGLRGRPTGPPWGCVRKCGSAHAAPACAVTTLLAVELRPGDTDKVLVICSEERGEYLREQTFNLGHTGAAGGNSVSTDGEEPLRWTQQTFLPDQPSEERQGTVCRSRRDQLETLGLTRPAGWCVRGRGSTAVERETVLCSHAFPGSHPGFAT